MEKSGLHQLMVISSMTLVVRQWPLDRSSCFYTTERLRRFICRTASDVQQVETRPQT